MAVPKVCGIETEYGNFIEGGQYSGSPERAALLVLGHCDALVRRSGGAARAQQWGGGQHDYQYGYWAYHWGPEFAVNAARIYEDHFHVEYSTQECLSARDLVACVKAGDAIINRAREAAGQALADGQAITILANNSDGQDNSYAGHLNLLISREAFDVLFERRPQAFYRCLIPFLVTSQVITGAGKVGAENGAQPAAYQLSQRADFIETAAVHAGTTSYRPLVNSRDEPLADPTRYGRLHLITFDTNRMEWALWLKAGMAQLVLAVLEDAVLEQGGSLPDLTLRDPVAAMHLVSRDLSLRAPLDLESGERLCAVEIQARLAQAAQSYVESGAAAGVVPEAAAIVEAWLETLALLQRADLHTLADRLDWAAKSSCLQAAGLALDDPRARVADLLYADINPGRSLYEGVFAAPGRARRVTRDEDVERMQTSAPANTRAFLRSELLRRFPGEITSVDWHRMTLRDDAGGWWSAWKEADLSDPVGLGTSQVAQRAGKAASAVDLCDRLGLLRDRAPVTSPALNRAGCGGYDQPDQTCLPT